jgi:hypothetical protein
MKRLALLSALAFCAMVASAQLHFSDCSSAYFACSKESLAIEALNGSGKKSSLADLSCFAGYFPETNSMWIKWKIAEPGSLSFVIIPLNEENDIDFVLFKMDQGLDNCSQKTELRCMASGKNRGEPGDDNFHSCTGATGLKPEASDSRELPGCQYKDDNFLAAIDAVAGEEYALFINNYYSNGGFLIEFNGSCEFSPIEGKCSTSAQNTTHLFLDGPSGRKIAIGEPFPNPVIDKAYLPITSDLEFYYARIQVISAQGVILQEQRMPISGGTQNCPISLEDFAPGVYFLKTTVEDYQHIVRVYKR